MDENDFILPWTSLETAFINLSLTTITLRPLGPYNTPDCFLFDVAIHLDNRNHDGQLLIDLTATPRRLLCQEA